MALPKAIAITIYLRSRAKPLRVSMTPDQYATFRSDLVMYQNGALRDFKLYNTLGKQNASRELFLLLDDVQAVLEGSSTK